MNPITPIFIFLFIALLLQQKVYIISIKFYNLIKIATSLILIGIMVKINLPKELLEKETFKTLPAKEKEEYVRNLIRKILELNLEGITISQIKEATGLTYSTIWHHLEVLSCTAQGHKISRGNLDVYYPTGKVTHLSDHDKGNVRYTLSIVESTEGNFVCVHEKRQNRLGNHTICNGMAIPFELIDDILADINKIKKGYLNKDKKLEKDKKPL